MRQNKTRFVYMFIVGIAISYLLHFIMKPPEHNVVFDLLASILITIIVWEGNLRIDHWMNQKFPWVTMPGRRVLIHLPFSIFFSALTIYISMLGFNKFICVLPETTRDAFMKMAVSMGVVISIMLVAIEIGMQFFGHWKNSLIEIEKYKTESLQAQLQNLKNQINPHFLFNNMSVLSSLVYKDQDKAVDFINQLSKVYRYLLDSKDEELTSLENELTFIKSYTYLLQIRFDTSINFDIQISDIKLNQLLPPLALQLLIENTIKHNEVSSDKPLYVSIKTENDILIVSNNIQLRSQVDENGKTGLQNIKDRYKYFTDLPVEILKNDQSFIVKIPLLHTK